MAEVRKKIIRKFEGTVVSNKMEKTVVVKVERQSLNKKYGKKFRVSKRYKCHAPGNQYKVGERVLIVACRPISKHKRWRVAKKIN